MKKIQNGPFFKMAVFQNRQFLKFFRENFTDQCSSTYMVVRLSDIRAKTAYNHKKCIFGPPMVYG